REIWLATLQVFGVYKEQIINGIDDLDVEQDLGSSSIVLEKKKRKRLGLFSRKRKENNTGSAVSSESSSVATSLKDVTGTAGLEDKYGQTKEFKETLANQSPEDLRVAYWSMVKHDHPDGLLLRFLRARK